MANQENDVIEKINNDVTEQILMHVPAISLLGFKLVCKNWVAMIQEPWFKKAHFERNNTTNEPLRIFIVKEGVSSGIFCEKDDMVVDVDSQRREIWIPRDLGSDGHFGGSCNGLLCTEVKGEIKVFNPITREVVSLPKPTYIRGFGSDEYKKMYTDFFFHSATGEYKVVLWYWNPTMTSFAVNLYTLGPNSSWRRVDDIISFPSHGGVNVKDTIYWPYLSEDYDAIISFDLSKEKIDVQLTLMKDGMLLSLPKWDSKLSDWKDGKLVGLTKWDDRLCGVTFQREHPSIKLWILELNNLGERLWTLRHEIQLNGMINGDVRLVAPYSIKMNRLFYATSEAIFYHDLSGKHDEVIKVTCSSSWEIKNCFAYVESLLPVPN